MRKVQYIVAVCFLGFFLYGCAGTGVVKSIKAAHDVSIDSLEKQMYTKPSFEIGKRFIYTIAWNGIPVGRVIAEVTGPEKYKTYDCFVAKVVTESNEFLSKIYRVEDTYISYIDTGNITSRRYEADRKEGTYRKHVVVEYDFDKKEATYTNFTDGSVKTCSIKENVQDPLSAMFYFMTLPVKLGDEINITVNLNEKNYDVFAKIESVDLVKGKFFGELAAFKVRPYALYKGERYKKGNAWIYVSADDKRLPLYGVVSIPFGKVTATLVQIENIG